MPRVLVYDNLLTKSNMSKKFTKYVHRREIWLLYYVPESVMVWNEACAGAGNVANEQRLPRLRRR